MLHLLLALALLSPVPVQRGTPVDVVVRGTVRANLFLHAPMGMAQSGQAAELSFRVHSQRFVDAADGSSRGYVIEPSSLALVFETGDVLHLDHSIFPTEGRSYFVLRDDDLGGDALFTSIDLHRPVGVPLDAHGAYDQTFNDLLLSPGPHGIASHDILDAAGLYQPADADLGRWTLTDGPFDPMLIRVDSLEIRPQGPARKATPSGSSNVATHTSPEALSSSPEVKR